MKSIAPLIIEEPVIEKPVEEARPHIHRWLIPMGTIEECICLAKCIDCEVSQYQTKGGNFFHLTRAEKLNEEYHFPPIVREDSPLYKKIHDKRYIRAGLRPSEELGFEHSGMIPSLGNDMGLVYNRKRKKKS